MIQQVYEHRVLCVITDAEIKWQPHLNHLCQNCIQKPVLAFTTRVYISVTAYKLFYNAHILSHITYASTVWDGCNEVHLSKTNQPTNKQQHSLHCREAKFNLCYLSVPTDDKLKTLNLLPLTKQLKYRKAVIRYTCRAHTQWEEPRERIRLHQVHEYGYGSKRTLLHLRIDLSLPHNLILSRDHQSVWNFLPHAFPD